MIKIYLCLALLLGIFSSTTSYAGSHSEGEVVVEEIEVQSEPAESKAKTLWKETKEKTGEAASSAAEYSKVQGGRILDASKTGIAKGADAVASGSVKAWDATKNATKSAVEFTGKTATKAGAAITDIVKGDDSTAPVTDKSVSE